MFVLLVALPLIARGRLPDRMATHWDADGRADGSMPFWGAVVFPALIWAVGCAASLYVALKVSRGSTAGWAGVGLPVLGLGLVGGQAAVVRANLDVRDWHDAGSTYGWIAGVVVVALTVGALAWLSRRSTPEPEGDRPVMDLPRGQRVAWFSRLSSPAFQAVAAVLGFAALAVAAASLGGMTGPWPGISLTIALGVASLLFFTFASVQVRVGEQGLRVSFGPLGWPARHWSVADIESARVEHRTPAQAHGWGYRINGLGTTVMLRGGECLVVRARGRDFAVSVDDAERGAALLNSLRALQG
ncbi:MULTISPECIES: DUF1648 domain-containing protein [unclassified Streptomyces]|uniref:DUF1648 domain-containing protein n=1 Tax=unclassified Streptomyces TaxID=2593676 RepID=UPI000DD76D34|nr:MULTISPECIES: DUF1648 domain-containing protein [unclassified Streptomyces]QZZ28542.1 DUF1648 domain-containing protein [Streptomyces sp. ST1015]